MSNSHTQSNVSSSGDVETGKDQVTTTTSNEDIINNTTNFNNNNSNNDSSSSSSCSNSEEDSSSNDPTTSSSTTTPTPPPSSSSILRPSILLRPASFSSSTTAPKITITPTLELPKPSGGMSFLRPSKLLVKDSPTTPPIPSSSSSSSATGGEQKPTFVPFTKDSNSVNGESKGEDDKEGGGAAGSSGSGGGGKGEFLFGEKLEDRVSSSQPSDRKRKVSNGGCGTAASSSVGSDGDEAEDQPTASKIPALEDVDVSTGEEGEINVIQVPCRLYNFDPSTTNWTERVSRGVLRLNDTDTTNSRLIVRTQGSLRLMLNTKVFNGMVVERPNDKSVKFTAVDIQDEASMGGVKVFLVMGSYTDMESLFNAMQHRLRRFNQQ